MILARDDKSLRADACIDTEVKPLVCSHHPRRRQTSYFSSLFCPFRGARREDAGPAQIPANTH